MVVVGSGGGALTGAALAAKAGLSVCVVEKTAAARRHLGLLRRRLLAARAARSSSAPASPTRPRVRATTSPRSSRTPTRRRCEAFLATAPRLVAELEDDPDLDFEWLPFSEYYDAPGRVPFGRSIQPTNVKRADLPPEVAELVRPPVERDRAGEGGRNTLTGGQALIARLAAIVVREGGTDPHQPPGHRAGHRPTTGTGSSAWPRCRPRVRSRSGRGAACCWPPAASRATRRCAATTACPATPPGRWRRAAPTPASRSRPPWRSARRPTSARSAGSAPASSSPTAAARSRSASAAG